MTEALLIKYGEIALRGGNRKIFEDKLITRIKRSLAGMDGYSVYKEQGRFIVRNDGGTFDTEKVVARVRDIFGLLAICPCVMTEDQSIENLKKVACEQVRGTAAKTFKVAASRSVKSYPLKSNDICAEIGEAILEEQPHLRVDVRKPELTVKVELRNEAYIYQDSVKGPGGLPYASGGKATLLLSGGFDSPVAGYLCARRGAEIEAVYFESPPFTSERAKDKVLDLAARLAHYTGVIKLYAVNFTETQMFLKKRVPPEKLTILLKRMMLRCAEMIALANKSMALIMGDSIGQVASQTMESILAIDGAAELPVLRPLCGMDKQEIIDLAEKIGTAEISMRPYEDCCTLFVADHPETRPKKSIIESIESGLLPELLPMMEQAAENAGIHIFKRDYANE